MYGRHRVKCLGQPHVSLALPWGLLRLREGEPPPQGGTAHVFTAGKVLCHTASHGREMGEQGQRQVQSRLLEPQDCHLRKLLGGGTTS